MDISAFYNYNFPRSQQKREQGMILTDNLLSMEYILLEHEVFNNQKIWNDTNELGLGAAGL